MTTTEPTTQAGRDHIAAAEKRHEALLDKALNSREADREEWADILGDYGVQEVRDAVLAVEAEAEARDATELREALDALSELDSLINMVGSGEYVTSNRKRLHLSNLNQRAVDAVRAALAAAPPEPRVSLDTDGDPEQRCDCDEPDCICPSRIALAALREGGRLPLTPSEIAESTSGIES